MKKLKLASLLVITCGQPCSALYFMCFTPKYRTALENGTPVLELLLIPWQIKNVSLNKLDQQNDQTEDF